MQSTTDHIIGSRKCNNINSSCASLTSNTQAGSRKDIEKNRRKTMKLLSFQLFSLIPPHHLKPKATMNMSERLNEATKYIQQRKADIELLKEKKEKLISCCSKKLQHDDDQYKASNYNNSYGSSTSSQSLNIQIHEVSPDVGVVLITGLNNHLFCNVVRVLHQYSNNNVDVIHANFSPLGPSTFHVHHNKMVEVADIWRSLNRLLNGSSKKLVEEEVTKASQYMEEEGNLDLWDFEICSDVWFRNS